MPDHAPSSDMLSHLAAPSTGLRVGPRRVPARATPVGRAHASCSGSASDGEVYGGVVAQRPSRRLAAEHFGPKGDLDSGKSAKG
jgi:hypothetical protein